MLFIILENVFFSSFFFQIKVRFDHRLMDKMLTRTQKIEFFFFERNERKLRKEKKIEKDEIE